VQDHPTTVGQQGELTDLETLGTPIPPTRAQIADRTQAHEAHLPDDLLLEIRP
jgi:hypothetical protein